MNAEQRQRASQLVRSQTEEEAIGEAFALLQELVDEQEPKPVAWIIQNRLTQACYVYATEQPADPNHIQVPVYTAPPAPEPEPSVPDWLETTQFLTDVTIAAGLLAYGRRDKGLAQRIGDFAHKYRMLAAAPERAPELVWDAERHQWLRTYNTAKHPAVTEAFFLGDENLDAEIDAAIAAEKGGA